MDESHSENITVVLHENEDEPIVYESVPEEPAPVVEEPAPVVEELAPVVEEPVPKIVFIVPYRDRQQQYLFFSKHMKTILEDMPKPDYKIYYIHQKDNRDFNRGAMKNIGFLMLKDKYPNDYKNITIVFNDIDNMPFNKNFLNYQTTHGNIKHFYGFTHTLGGIVSVKAGDFEKMGGFPNFWAWGYEDNALQKRAFDTKLNIDRTQFYPHMDKNILLLHAGITRTINRREFDRYISNTNEGFHSISQLQYMIDETTGMVDVNQFTTQVEPLPTQNKEYDLRNGTRPFNNNVRKKISMKMLF